MSAMKDLQLKYVGENKANIERMPCRGESQASICSLQHNPSFASNERYIKISQKKKDVDCTIASWSIN